MEATEEHFSNLLIIVAHPLESACSKSMLSYILILIIRWLCHPLRLASAIQDRQDAVEDLIAVQGISNEIRTVLGKLPDLERIVTSIHGEKCTVKEFVRVIQAMKRVLVRTYSLNHQGFVKDFKPYISNFKSKALLSIFQTGFPQALMDRIAYFEDSFDSAEALEESELSLCAYSLLLDLIKTYEGVDEVYDTTERNVWAIELKLDENLNQCRNEIG